MNSVYMLGIITNRGMRENLYSFLSCIISM